MVDNTELLVTGGAGYIGSHTVHELVSAGYRVVVVDDLSKGNRTLLPQEAIFYHGNAGDISFMNSVFAKHNIDCVLHFAGSIVVSESVKNPLKYYQNNTAVSRNLLESCVRYNIKNFIFSSTASVYGSNPEKVMKEDFVPSPENPYAASKLMTEMMIKDVAKANNMNYTILRYFNVAGADTNGKSGQISDLATHLIKIACEHVCGKRKEIQVFGTDYGTEDGTCVRDYIHVSDLANAHLKAYEYMKKHNKSETFNCGYGKGYSVLEILANMQKVSGKELNIKKSSRRAGDPEALIANSDKIKKLAGWEPKFNNIETILKTALEWEKTLDM